MAKKLIKEENTVMSTNKKTIRIAGNAIVLTSRLKLETIKKMEKFNPNTLALVEVNKDEENEIFRIETGTIGSISKYGICFNSSNKEGYAQVTTLLPEGVTDKKGYIKDNLATVIFMLKDLEEAVNSSCAQLDAAFAQLDSEIVEEE